MPAIMEHNHMTALCSHVTTPSVIPRLFRTINSRHRVRAVQEQSYNGNLGVLRGVIEQAPVPGDDPYAMQRVSPDSFGSRGYYTDGPAIFGSLVLLIVLLALSFERILGLDRFVVQAVKNWKESRQYGRREEIIKAREVLEDSWEGNDDTRQQ